MTRCFEHIHIFAFTGAMTIIACGSPSQDPDSGQTESSGTTAVDDPGECMYLPTPQSYVFPDGTSVADLLMLAEAPVPATLGWNSATSESGSAQPYLKERDGVEEDIVIRLEVDRSSLVRSWEECGGFGLYDLAGNVVAAVDGEPLLDRIPGTLMMSATPDWTGGAHFVDLPDSGWTVIGVPSRLDALPLRSCKSPALGTGLFGEPIQGDITVECTYGDEVGAMPHDFTLATLKPR